MQYICTKYSTYRMEKEIKLYTYVDGINDTPFPNEQEQIVIANFKYDANRMGDAPSIEATAMHRLCLDNLWTDNVYAEFNGEKYFIMNTPSSNKSNEDERYEHQLILKSEREVLNHVYFIDAVQGDSGQDQVKSNSTKVQFMGDIKQFVERLNASLSYTKMEYTAVIDEGITSEDKMVEFEDQYVLQALQEIYNVYELPYYFDGKTIHVGYEKNAITTPFKYGYDEALLSVSKENANYKVVNRCSGYGSEENIPYYYPNNSPKGDASVKVVSGNISADKFVIYDYEKFVANMSPTDTCSVRKVQEGDIYKFVWSVGGKDIELSDIGIRLASGVIPTGNESFTQTLEAQIPYSQYLMPPVYRETKGKERFYNAKNDTYPIPDGEGYYTFENEYSEKNPDEMIVEFSDIKPTIKGITNLQGQRIDMFLDFAYDQNDNDEVDSEGNYLHPYFFAKLRKTDGEFGFNLFDHASEDQTMQISFTSGVCGSCTFEIGVGEETNQNIVQVDDNGNLKRDEEGNVLWENQSPQPRQNDTQNYEVWIALKKDDTTYTNVMPNASMDLKPSTSDTFVILGINLPQAYITAAENKLKEEIIKYMWMNNSEKFNFSIKFSRIYFSEHPEVLELLNENSRLIVEYNGTEYTFYVDNFTYTMDGSSSLPEIEVNLVDTLTIGKNSLETAISEIKQDILSTLGGGDFLKQGLKYFLRKDINDYANGQITFNKGLLSDNISSKDFSSGPFGTGFTIKRDSKTGKSYIEADEIYIRLKAYFDTLEIKHLSHVGGRVVLSPASMECTRVEVISTDMDALCDYNGDPLYDVESSRLYALKTGTRSVNVYRCYFKQSDDTKEIINEFAVDDLAQCREFNVKENVSQNVSNQYYWRRVVAVGKDYIDLSADDCDAGSMEPKAGDTIVTIGNKTNASRQHVVFLSSYDDDAPCIKLYSGINDYSMLNKEVTVISPNADKNVFTGKVIIKPGSEGFGNLTDAPDMNEIGSSISDAKNAALDAQDAANTAQGAVSDLNDYVDGAFSDGIIEKSEAQAIEKYINTVNQTKKEVEATYNVLYTNPYLTGTAKTTLLNAKVSFFADVDVLIESINTAISDGKTTASEKSNVDSKYNAFNSSYATLSTAIENANKAIQDKLKELAAQEAVESVRSEIESVSDKAKDDLAKKMGYSSFSAMVTAAEKGETIISGGHINTDLIEADAIITSALIASAIKTNRLNVNDKFIVEKDGTFKGVEGVLERMSINGSLRSPFSYDGFTGIIIGGQKKLVTNNIIVTNPSGGNLLSFIPGGDDYDGFSATIINYDSEEGKAVGSVQFQCTYPIWEGGKQTTFTILDAYEGIDIQGFSNGSSFIGWIIKNRFKLSASAVEMVNVSAHADPAEGGTINGTGIKPVGTKGTLQAIANSGYLFKRWNDDTTNASKEVIWDVDKQYTAYFEVKPATKYTLTLNVSPAGSGTVSGAGQYDAGTEAKISATPNSGYAFDRWSDGDTNTSRYITMNSSKTFTAYFAEHTVSEDNLLADPKVTVLQSTNDAFGAILIGMLIISNKKTSEYEYADGILTINKGYLAGRIKAGLKYRLTFEHFGGDGQEAFYAGIGDLGEDPSNSSNWDLLYDGSVDAIVIGQGDSSQKTTFTKEFTARRTSTASDGLFFAGRVKDFVYITNFELKEI